MMNKVTEYFIKTKKSIYDVSKKFNISQNEVIDILKSDGFLYAKPKVSSKLIIDLKYATEEYLANENINIEEICKKYNVSHTTFPRYLKDYLGIKIKNRIKSKFNDAVFDSIDTEEKAYWLGFIYADGYISNTPNEYNKKNVYTFELSLKSNDYKHLEKLRALFKTKRPVIKSNVRCRLLVNSQHLWNTLNNYGCTPKKSLTLEFPDEKIFKDKSLIRHFIRGYFDGDGCISYSNKEHSTLNMQLLGTKNFLQSLLLYLPNDLKYLNIRHNHNNDNELTYLINTSNKKAIKFFKYLYKDSLIYLDRKYLRFARYISNDIDERGKIGEGCDANPELISKIAKGFETV